MAASDPLQRQVQIQEALLKLQAEQSLRSFVEQAWPILEPGTRFLPNWHIDVICEYLEAVTAGEITHLVINLPPRYMKSLLMSVLWPTWEWIRRPQGRWIFVSYDQGLASRLSLDRRTVLLASWFQSRWGDRIQLADDQNAKHEFYNTQRGMMVARSMGGSVTGRGGDRIIIDDPHNPTEVESDAERERVIMFFTHALSTRLDDKMAGATVLVMQRLHEADLSARCQELGYTSLCLPAIAEVATEIRFPRSGRIWRRAPGDCLWPARENAERLALQRRMMGEIAFAAQYQQQPAPPGGLIFRRDAFKWSDDVPPAGAQWDQSWDVAFKNGRSNDFVVGLVAARLGANYYIVDRVKGQWDFTETCRHLVELKRRYPQTQRVYIEDAANGPAIVNVLRGQVPGIIPVTPQGSKEARAQAAQPFVEAGNVWLPNPRPHGRLIPERAWVDDFLHQLCCFPNGAHDDDVDAFTQLVAQWAIPQVIPRIRLL